MVTNQSSKCPIFPIFPNFKDHWFSLQMDLNRKVSRQIDHHQMNKLRSQERLTLMFSSVSSAASLGGKSLTLFEKKTFTVLGLEKFL